MKDVDDNCVNHWNDNNQQIDDIVLFSGAKAEMRKPNLNLPQIEIETPRDPSVESDPNVSHGPVENSL